VRPETRQRLIGQIEAGQLALLAGINGALAAIDSEDLTAEPAARADVSDDGQIRLTLYRDDGAAFAAPLAPGRAVALAGELIAAALPKLPR
jgi:hypothetical protein